MPDQPAPGDAVVVRLPHGRSWRGVVMGAEEGLPMVQVAPHMMILCPPDRMEPDDDIPY